MVETVGIGVGVLLAGVLGEGIRRAVMGTRFQRSMVMMPRQLSGSSEAVDGG